MSVIDQIQDILDDGTITPEERKRVIGRLRAFYMKVAVEDLPLPRVFIRGQFTVVLTKLEQHGISLHVWLYVTRRAQEIKINYPIIIVRPPLLVSDPAGDIIRGEPPNTQTFRFDPREAFQNVITDVILASL